MLLEPRWAKILRDLTAHKLRTMLVVLSIAVGIFAIVVVMGGRGMLIDSFAVNFPKSNPMSATMFTSDFGDLVTAAVARDPRVAMVEARRSETFRYRVGALASVADPPAGVAVANRSRSISLTASRDWSAQKIDKVFAQGGATWPPARGEVLLEMSVRQVIPVVVGDSITVDVGANERRELRVAGFAHDINAFPSMFTSTDSGFVSMETMGDLKRPTSENVILLTLQKTGLKLHKEIIAHDDKQCQMRTIGTAHLVEIMNDYDLLPTKNFRFGSHPEAVKLASWVWKEKFTQNVPDGCWFGCTLSCAARSPTPAAGSGNPNSPRWAPSTRPPAGRATGSVRRS